MRDNAYRSRERIKEESAGERFTVLNLKEIEKEGNRWREMERERERGRQETQFHAIRFVVTGACKTCLCCVSMYTRAHAVEI